uniref:Uncharacterized protein n=1 Tax=Arundo donax TaxID=35708 RepID=A0A0A9GHX3_ARUDO
MSSRMWNAPTPCTSVAAMPAPPLLLISSMSSLALTSMFSFDRRGTWNHSLTQFASSLMSHRSFRSGGGTGHSRAANHARKHHLLHMLNYIVI